VHDPRLCERARYLDVERIRRAVDEGPYDAVVCLSPENVPYFSGFYNMDIRLIPERLHIIVWRRGQEPSFVVMQRRAEQLTPRHTFISDVRGYQGEGLDSMRVLAEALGGARTVGVEGRSFPGGHLLDLRERLPGLRFADAHDWFERLRGVKTPAERETIIRGARITCEAIDAAFREARPGETERRIAARMQYEMLARGIDMINAPLLAAGPRTGLWHALPGDHPVEPGMLIKTDSGGYIDGYYSDIARTVVMGRATPRQRDIHAKCTEIKHRIVAAMRPGLTAAELAELGRAAYRDVGLEFRWHILGHSIGLAIHEAPQIYPWVKEPLEAGMMMMIEVGYSDPPEDSFHVEDLVEVTETGAEYRTDAGAHERIWEIGL
jgi:Xaa-Pro aminopeptidase